MNNLVSKPELHSFCARHAQLFQGVNGYSTPKELGFLLGRGFSRTQDPDIYNSRAFRVCYLTSLEKLSKESMGFQPKWGKALQGGRYLVASVKEPRIGRQSCLSEVLEPDLKIQKKAS